MQGFLGSVRNSLDFRNLGGSGVGEPGGGAFGGFVEKINSSIRKSRIGIEIFSSRNGGGGNIRALLPPAKRKGGDEEGAAAIRWRKGELIGCGAFGRVYMGMNLDSGELLAVKQVLIAANSASRERTQSHIRELEEEVKLLRNLSHPNIVRYLGTAREEDSLNILLEFVPGGSISSLLGKFGSFPESVVRTYTKQLLLGLEYLHKNGIMHRDIKGANILVDNKGCIKLADFGASKKVVELATINGAKSMKGTPYWMAPEVILQTGHSFSADIWSVGCTVIEMATGKPPWSEQYQEVAALFHIGTTKSHPPIPEHLSAEAKDFLLKCLQKEPELRTSASDLLRHPFVTSEYLEGHPLYRTSVLGCGNMISTSRITPKSYRSSIIRSASGGLKDVSYMDDIRFSPLDPGSYRQGNSPFGVCDSTNDMCQIDDDLMNDSTGKFNSISDNLNKSFNPMSEPADYLPCKFDESPGLEQSRVNQPNLDNGSPESCNGNIIRFPDGQVVTEDDDELTESKIRAFLDEKALDLKKLQTPLYEEFYNTLNATSSINNFGNMQNENAASMSPLPPKSKSPSRLPSRRFSVVIGLPKGSPGNRKKHLSIAELSPDQVLQEIQPQEAGNFEEVNITMEATSPSNAGFCERQRRWKEELDQELERKRQMLRQAIMGGKISSPKYVVSNGNREALSSAFPGK
ncbi:hypothetical protein MLD38_036170 [Melastoma candidum]|uniref:Uncharacterized protein n=1 Tax=Melastoma candidum TaxID=119954 RepID=A0ACB9LJF2_9MYRT|nr:hypothetical protein MLD38_036170 [Melastoma candidum]